MDGLRFSLMEVAIHVDQDGADDDDVNRKQNGEYSLLITMGQRMSC